MARDSQAALVALNRGPVGRLAALLSGLDGALEGVLHDHLGVSERVLAETVFPDSASVKAMKGLVE